MLYFHQPFSRSFAQQNPESGSLLYRSSFRARASHIPLHRRRVSNYTMYSGSYKGAVRNVQKECLMSTTIQMTGAEIRERFLSFFESKGHTIVPSSSLVPRNDPTVLLTTAAIQHIHHQFLVPVS